jgi:hypothetical protein
MMVQSHLLGALLLGLVVSRARPFAPRDWALALGFAVAIDLDHLVQVPAYLLSHGGFAALAHPTTMIHWGASWQGFMHSWWALTLVVPATLLFRSWVPAAFWGLHMFQDYVIAKRFVVFGSAQEFAIDIILLAVVMALFAWDHRATHEAKRKPSLARHVAATFGLAK